MQFRFHTKALLYNPEGKVLVLQRADTGKWDLIGGKTELPEKIEEAIVREIQEETGMNSVKNLKKDAENPQRTSPRRWVLTSLLSIGNIQIPIR